jgi:hypothetical protein
MFEPSCLKSFILNVTKSNHCIRAVVTSSSDADKRRSIAIPKKNADIRNVSSPRSCFLTNVASIVSLFLISNNESDTIDSTFQSRKTDKAEIFSKLSRPC